MTRLLTSAVLIVLLLAVAACSTDDEGDDAADTADDTATEEVAEDNGEDEEAEETTEPEEEETASPESDEADEDEESDAEDATPTEETGDDEEADESDESEDDSESGDSRTITHSLGETEVPADPERVVALEWTYAEDLLSLGVQPVGVADTEGYEAWVDVGVELDDDVGHIVIQLDADIGTRQEPSLESIAELEPDLIIGVQFRHEPIYDQLSDIAPTLMFNPYPEDESVSQFDEMEQTLMTIAEAVGREDDGQQVLDDMHATFDEIQAEIEDADIENQFVLAQAFTSDSSPQMRVFIDTSMAVQILESIGLENAWDGEFDVYGFNTTGIESLTTVEDASFLYVAQDDDNPFQEQWADNPVWNDLTFVQEDRVYPLGGETWLFGGPLSAEVLAEQVRDIFLEAE